MSEKVQVSSELFQREERVAHLTNADRISKKYAKQPFSWAPVFARSLSGFRSPQNVMHVTHVCAEPSPSLPGGGGYSHTLPIRICAAQRGLEFRTGYPFQRHFLERGIIFRTHESSSFVSSYLKLFKDRLLLKIRFNALTSKLLYSSHPRMDYKKLAHF